MIDKIKLGWAASVLGAAGLAVSAEAATVQVAWRDPADGRGWEVLTDPAAPLEWVWADGATEATLSASNVLTGVTSSTDVSRNGAIGSATLPAVGSGLRLVDVILTQKAGGSVLSTENARLRLGEKSEVYAAKTEKGFARMPGDRIFSWSPDWAESEGEPRLATAVDAVPYAVRGLSASGGHDVLSVNGDFPGFTKTASVSLIFGDETAWETALRVGVGGLLLIYR